MYRNDDKLIMVIVLSNLNLKGKGNRSNRERQGKENAKKCEETRQSKSENSQPNIDKL